MDALFERYYRPLVVFAESYLHDLQSAEDLVQEQMVKLWSKQTFAGIVPEALGTFLFTVVKNACINWLEKKRLPVKSLDLLHYQIALEEAEQKAIDFITFLPEMRRILSTDVTAMYNGDPAAQNKAEVILCYPAIRAICNYRIAHKLLELDVPLIPRIITEMAHSETGIDIHPGAVIGEYFAIDHGTGVVIGATSVIGNRVKLYQGVTLGARSFPLDENNNPIKGIARHPIIEDDVIIYSNATILGRITIGKGAVIGGNIWVTENVAPGERLVQAKAKP